MGSGALSRWIMAMGRLITRHSRKLTELEKRIEQLEVGK